jgi:hypothetical protein
VATGTGSSLAGCQRRQSGTGQREEPVGQRDATPTTEDSDTVRVSIERYGGSDIGAAFNNAREEHGFRGVHYVIDPGNYDLRTPIDLTGIRGFETDGAGGAGVTLDLQGVVLTQRTPIGIDMTGSHNSITVLGGKIWGDLPKNQRDVQVGVLQSRAGDSRNPSGIHQFFGLHVSGVYEVAPLYNVSSESNGYFSCQFFNKRFGNWGPEGSYGVYVGGDNPAGVESPHDEIGVYRTTTQTNAFLKCNIRGHTGVRLRPSPGNPIRITRFYACYGDSASRWVLFDLEHDKDLATVSFRDCQVTDGNSVHAFEATKTPAKRTIRLLSITGGWYHTTEEAIMCGGEGRNVTLDQCTIGGDVEFDTQIARSFRLGAVRNSVVQNRTVGAVQVDGDLIGSTVGSQERDLITVEGSTAGSELRGYFDATREFVDDGQSVTVGPGRVGLPTYGSVEDAPADTLFFHTGDGALVYKSEDGALHQV